MTIESLREIEARRVLKLLSVWFVVQLVTSEVVPVSVRIVINLRLDRVLLVSCCLGFLSYSRRARVSVRLNKVEGMMALFFVILMASTLTSGSIHDPRNRTISSIFTFIGYPAVAFYMTRRLSFSRENIRRLLVVWLLIGVYLGLTGIFEHYHMKALIYPRFITDPALGIHYGRSRGPFLQAAALGSALSMIVVTSLFYHHWWARRQVVALLAMVVMVTTIYFTYTRSGWLQLAASLMVLSLFSKDLRKYFIATGLALVLLYFSGIFSKFSFWSGTLFGQRQQPIESRKLIYAMSLQMFLARKVAGFGYGTFEKYSALFYASVPGFETLSRGEGSHNMILGLLAETGLLGVIPYLAIYYYFAKEAFAFYRRNIRNSYLRDLVAVYLAILAGFGVQMQIIDVRWFNFLNSFVFVVGGVVFSLSREQAQALRSSQQGRQ